MCTSERRLHAEARVGTCLCGKWRIERLLGIGGTSAVFAARYRNGVSVAIKMLHRELAEDPQVRTRFLAEAMIANRVEHPAVVRVLDDDDSDEPFLVLELVEGQTLAQVVDRSPLGRSELLDVVEQLLDVLACAHAMGIVHRDIKPQNLLLDGRNTLRVLDFGMARVLDDEGLRTAFDRDDCWDALEYVAPELLSGTGEVSPAVDIYAVGATLFLLASMQPLHERRHDVDPLEWLATTPARSLAAVTSALDPAVVHLVDRATMFRAGDRWQSAEEMLERVQRLLHGRVRRRFVSAAPPRPASDRPPEPLTIRERATLPYPTDGEVSTVSGEFPTRIAV